MKLLQIILILLDCGLSMVLVLCHMVRIHHVLEAQQGICEGNCLACQRVWKSLYENWYNPTPDCSHLHTTWLHHLAILVVESSEARIWGHYRPELIESGDPGMWFKEGRYPVHRTLKHTEVEGIKNIRYDNSCRRDAFHIPDDTFRGSNRLICQILSCFPSLCLISLSREYHLLEVYALVFYLPWQWVHFSKAWFRCLTHRAMWLYDLVQVNVFEVVSRAWTADSITMPHPAARTKHKLSNVEMLVARTKNQLGDPPYNLSIVDLLILHGSCSSMSITVIFLRNGK